MDKLKLCPFCGNEPHCLEVEADNTFPNRYYCEIICEWCGATMENDFKNREEAFNAWNRRIK